MENVKQRNVMKEKKTISVGVRLSPTQEEILKSHIAVSDTEWLNSSL